MEATAFIYKRCRNGKQQIFPRLFKVAQTNLVNKNLVPQLPNRSERREIEAGFRDATKCHFQCVGGGVGKDLRACAV